MLWKIRRQKTPQDKPLPPRRKVRMLRKLSLPPELAELYEGQTQTGREGYTVLNGELLYWTKVNREEVDD